MAKGDVVTDPELLALLNQGSSSDQPQQTTATGAVAAGLGQAAFGLGDEIAAGVGAAYDYVTGGDKGYDQRLKEQRQYLDAAARENPVAYYGAQIAGTVAAPFTAPGRLATRGAAELAKRVAARYGGAGTSRFSRNALMAGIEGAGYGAAYGAGSSEGGPQARLEGAALGAGVGALGGAASVPISNALMAGVNSVRNTARSVINPNMDAARRVAEARRLDLRSGGPQQITGDMIPADVGNVSGRLAREVSNISPEASTLLKETVMPRAENQTSRFLGFMQRSLGLPSNRYLTQEALQKQAAKLNSGSYRRSFDEGDRVLLSPKIEDLTGSNLFKNAMLEANKTGTDVAILGGYTPFNTFAQVTKDGRITFTGKGGVAAYPNLQYWDAVKRNLDSVASTAYRQGDKQVGGRAAAMARELRNELDKLVPSYKATRTQAMEFFNANDALEAGAKFIRGGRSQSADAAEQVIKKMSGRERALFKQGAYSALVEDMQNMSLNRDISKNIANSLDKQRRLKMAFGDKKAKELEAFLHIEKLMERTKNQVVGNSTTAQQITDALTSGGAGLAGLALSGDPQTALLSAILTGGVRKGGRAVKTRMANRVAELLVKEDPASLAKAAKIIETNPQILENLRRATTALAGSSAGQSNAQETPLRVTVTGDDVAEAQGR